MAASNCRLVELIIIIVTVCGCASGVLRNPITDRCIHIGRNEDNEMTVLARPCTFSNPRTGKEGHPDQWIEVVAMDKYRPVKVQHTIQKQSGDSLLCFLSFNNSVKVGSCSSSDAILNFKKIQEMPIPRPSYESTFSGPVFTIEQPGTNKCLTVFPGDMILHFTKCSENKPPFQRWSTCRHVGACDVEMTWSPAKIVFPNNSLNFTNVIENSEMKTVPMKIVSVSSTTKECKESESNVIVSEPLYFIFNGLKLIHLSEMKLVQVISKFYSSLELQRALDLIKEHFSFDIEPRPLSMQKSIQIVNFMSQIINNKLNSGVVFASQNLARVPPIYAIKTATVEDAQNEQNIESLEEIKKNLETSLKSVLQSLNMLKSTPMMSKNSSKAHSITSSVVDEPKTTSVDAEESEQSMIDIIDLRGGRRKRA